MTCAKRTVVCILEPPLSRRHMTEAHIGQIVGINGCGCPQKVCPRLPGEGYDKCKTVCNQRDHAERDALRAARELGVDLTGWTATVYGHNYTCADCGNALIDAGIACVTVRPEPYKHKMG